MDRKKEFRDKLKDEPWIRLREYADRIEPLEKESDTSKEFRKIAQEAVGFVFKQHSIEFVGQVADTHEKDGEMPLYEWLRAAADLLEQEDLAQ